VKMKITTMSSPMADRLREEL